MVFSIAIILWIICYFYITFERWARLKISKLFGQTLNLSVNCRSRFQVNAWMLGSKVQTCRLWPCACVWSYLLYIMFGDADSWAESRKFQRIAFDYLLREAHEDSLHQNLQEREEFVCFWIIINAVPHMDKAMAGSLWAYRSSKFFANGEEMAAERLEDLKRVKNLFSRILHC